MKNKLKRTFTTLFAVMLCTAAFSINALAAEATPSPTMSTSSTMPLTPDGTGTVIDNVMNEGGKEFFTITTPSKHVFYLIIDRQKTAQNVYFLDAVTEKDLLALAQCDSAGSSTSTSSKVTTTTETETPPVASPTTGTTSTSQPEKKNNMLGIAVVVLLMAVMVGVAVWFFKFRKPKKAPKGKVNLDEYDYSEGEDEEIEPDDEPMQRIPDQSDDANSETEDDA